MYAIALAAGLTLPWLLGVGALFALRPARTPVVAGEGPWLLGTGYLLGAFLLTLWMRALSVAGVHFSLAAIALPLCIAAFALFALGWRRQRAVDPASDNAHAGWFALPTLTGALRVLWWLLLAWLALRFALLAVEVATRPLYPWDAWTQWATKARVWFEFGRIVPFARVNEWLAANGSVYFDASPEYPPTMPLLQVWSCLLIGRWDDTLMNWPWWQAGVALTLVVYGGLRRLAVSAPASLIGAFLVATLPLSNVHVALAGYADLPLAAFYAAAVLAFLHWASTRDPRDAGIAALLLVACTQIKNPGWFWAATLLPAAVVVLLPRRGVRLAWIGFAVAIALVIVLARIEISVFNYRLKFDFAPAWGDLVQSYFLLGNWHLLWYGAVGAALLAWRQLLSARLAPLTMIVAAGLLFLFFVFAFTNASAYVADQTTINRATLHMAPVIVVFLVLAWQAFAQCWAAAHPPLVADAGPAAPPA